MNVFSRLRRRFQKMKLLAGLLLLLTGITCAPLVLYARLPGSLYRFERLTQRDGLSQAAINCILQDQRGFMWFGTQDGLNRFDGYTFIVYRHNPGNPNSLSQSWIQAMAEEKEAPGVLWIGTNGGGLNRFDSGELTNRRFVHSVDDSGSLRHDRITALCVDSRRRLWIGSENGLDMLELSRFKDTASPEMVKPVFIHWRHNPRDDNSLSDNRITAVHEDSNGFLWVGTQNGLNRMAKEGGYFTRFYSDPVDESSVVDNQISAIEQDRKGNLWIGSLNSGLCLLRPGSNRFERFVSRWGDPETICSNSVSSILADKEGYIWIGTGNVSAAGNGLTRIAYNNLSHRWDLVHFKYGAERESVDRGGISEFLNDKTVLSLWEDRSGGLWVGSFQGGINRLSKRRVKFHHYWHQPAGGAQGLSSNSVLSFCEDDNDVVWVGSYWSGLDRFDMKTGSFTNYRHKREDPHSLGSNAVWKIVKQPGVLWLGLGGGGLDRMDLKTGRFTHHKKTEGEPGGLRSNSIIALLYDSGGVLWLGTWDGGLHSMDPQTGVINPHPLKRGVLDSDEPVTDIYQDHLQEIWVCTYGKGLIRKSLVSPDIQTFRHNSPGFVAGKAPSGDYLLCIREDAAGNLWIGSSTGLMKLRRGDMTFTCYNEKDGLPNNVVYGIVPWGEYLWLSTNNGLSRFHAGSGAFRNYGMEEGVQGLEFNQGAFLITRNGWIFMGGVNGMNVFHPGDIVENSVPPPIVISRFLKINRPVEFDRSVSVMDSIHLSYQDRFFTFEFAALDFENPSRNKYAYKLEGFDDGWVECDTRRNASYTNLDGGNYVFHVRGSNSDNVWNAQGISINVHISPPWWQNWWFRISAILLFNVLLLVIYRLRVRDVRRAARQEQLERELRLKAQFTAMLVHDLRNPLQSIRGYAELIDLNPASDKLSKYVSLIKHSSDDMLGLIRDMLDLSKFEAGKMTIVKKTVNLEDLIHRSIEMIQPLTLRRQIRVDLELERLDPVCIDPVRVSQVIGNLLSNAVKFSPKGGRILVAARLVREGDVCFQEVSVADDGPGIPPERVVELFSVYGQLEDKNQASTDGTGLGLAVAKLIIEAHDGHIGYRPRERGSVFYFRLPVRPAPIRL